MAVYGLARIAFDLLGPVPWWMAPVLIMAGAGTAVTGIALALADGGMKRVLAWSTIKNFGVILAALGLALAAALAAACFVRFYGVAFLGRPRSDAAATARETDGWSRAGMAALAGLCVLLGVLPGIVIDLIAPAVRLLAGAGLAPQSGNAWATLVPVPQGRMSYSGLLVVVFVALSGGAAAWLVHRLASRRLRRAPAWDCGFPEASPLTQYGAGSFAQPLRRVLAPLMAARERVEMPPPGAVAPARLAVHVEDLAWTRLYLPLAAGLDRVTARLNALQFLTIRRYLALVFATLVLLLVGLALWN